jgi:hypothetical protein
VHDFQVCHEVEKARVQHHAPVACMCPIDTPSSCFALAPQPIQSQHIKCPEDECCTSRKGFETGKLKRELNVGATSPLSPGHKDQLQKGLKFSVNHNTAGCHVPIAKLLVAKHQDYPSFEPPLTPAAQKH